VLEQCRFTGSDVRIRDDHMPLAHVALAVEGAGWASEDNLGLMVANTIIGSWDRSHCGGENLASNLAKECAKGGLAHSFQSFNTCYTDTGLWGIYFVTDRFNQHNFIAAAQAEWRRLAVNPREHEVDRAKNLLMTNMLLQLDGSTQVCEDIGRQMLCYGRRIPIEELQARFDKITPDTVKEVCQKYVYDVCPAMAGIGPIEGLTDYNVLRGGMWSLVH